MQPVSPPDFSALFHSAPSAYLVLSPGFQIVAVNDTYCQVTMTKREDIMGRFLFDVFPDNPDDRDATGVANLRASLQRVLRLKRPDAMALQKYDIPVPGDASGRFEERHWSPLNVPVVDSAKNVLWIIHRVVDVTAVIRLMAASQGEITTEERIALETLRASNKAMADQIEAIEQLDRERHVADMARIKAGDLLRESEERFRTLANNLPGVIYRRIVSEDGSHRDVFISDGLQKLLGVEPQAVIGRGGSLLDFVHPEDRERKLRALKVHGEKLETLVIEVRKIAQPDGRVRWWQIHTTPSSLPGGNVQWDGVALDVTDRKMIESQLNQAIKMEAIGQLTGGVAHDFNNLLTVILGNAEVLVNQLGEHTRLREFALLTQRAAERGAELTSRLLAFSRKQALEPRATNVNDLVARVESMLARSLGQNIEIEIVAGPDLWTTQVDRAQLESALLNLALNARDAMPEGGKLKIETSNVLVDESQAALNNEPKAGAYVLIAVSDSGTGMKPEVMSRVFEPFFTTKEVGKGTGLGLPMVYGFVMQSEGHVKLYSESGNGTTVKIYLPKSDRSVSSESDVESSARDVKAGGGERILLVEDDPLVRQHAERLLADLGYHIIVAASALDALKILSTDATVDLLFTDVVMPGGISGPKLAEMAGKLRPDLAVLFTSGYTENALGSKGVLPPDVHLLSKPYRLDELAVKLRQIL
ncbi:MAG: ATP-binding protein [Micropepsaceae bacterium]